jgi:hypothetical protein
MESKKEIINNMRNKFALFTNPKLVKTANPDVFFMGSELEMF